MCGTTGIPVGYTPYGRSWNVNDGTMGTTANAVFLANVYGQAIYSSATAGYPAKGARYVCWARSQVCGWNTSVLLYLQDSRCSCPAQWPLTPPRAELRAVCSIACNALSCTKQG